MNVLQDSLKQEIIEAIENFNEEELKEVATFVKYLKYRQNSLEGVDLGVEKASVSNGAELNFDGEMLPIEEIRDRYPREWVLIGDTECDEVWNVLRGKVLLHSPDRDEIDRQLSSAFEKINSIAIEYTGPIPEDYAVML